MAYVQRGATMPAACTEHLRLDPAPSHAPEDGPAEPSDEAGSFHSEQMNGLGSAAALAAPAAVASEQASAEVTARSAVSACRSTAAVATGSPSSCEPPQPEALSWYLCTDEIVKPVSWDAVAKCKAYILLYMRTQ